MYQMKLVHSRSQAFWRNHFKLLTEQSVNSIQLHALQKLMSVRHMAVKRAHADGIAKQAASAALKIVAGHAQLASLWTLVLVEDLV